MNLNNLIEQEQIYVYPDSTYELDCRHNLMTYDCPACMAEKTNALENPSSQFFATQNGFGATHGFSEMNQHIHDTFSVDRYNNLYDGHTTLEGAKNRRMITFELKDIEMFHILKTPLNLLEK